MKKSLFIVTLIFASVVVAEASSLFWGQIVKGNGKVTKENRSVNSFQGVSASAGINVYLFAGDEEKVIVETDENLQDCLITKVKGNTLECYFDCNIRKSTKTNVYVTYRKINHIHASSGSNVTGETPIKAQELEIKANSAADIKAEVYANTIECYVASGADVELDGKASHFKGRADSGADLKAQDLTAETADVNSSSGANIQIAVTKSIDADASSGGNVEYFGKPQNENVHESSGGDVRRR
ncbi:MAG TPA: head GIN domain-containing protein [Prolixibacteraceae bacterium]|nr:head GIN domain-containing protein [Prolixibacteraceae bacterium]